MDDRSIFEVQRLYPQIYLACHIDHVRAGSTKWDLSSHDASFLAHLDTDRGSSPRSLASHLGVVPSTLSATLKRLEKLGYISIVTAEEDRRRREIVLTARGAEAIAGTSVLDGKKVKRMLQRLSDAHLETALKGLRLLANAANELSEENEE